jgi:peptidyl-tRNA hydrolase
MKRPAGGGPLERFVLKPFSPSERKQLPDIFATIDAAVAVVIEQGVEAAMNQYN